MYALLTLVLLFLAIYAIGILLVGGVTIIGGSVALIAGVTKFVIWVNEDPNANWTKTRQKVLVYATWWPVSIVWATLGTLYLSVSLPFSNEGARYAVSNGHPYLEINLLYLLIGAFLAALIDFWVWNFLVRGFLLPKVRYQNLLKKTEEIQNWAEAEFEKLKQQYPSLANSPRSYIVKVEPVGTDPRDPDKRNPWPRLKVWVDDRYFGGQVPSADELKSFRQRFYEIKNECKKKGAVLYSEFEFSRD